MKRKLLVFCGSSDGNKAAYIITTRKLGVLIVDAGDELVYGGGVLGCMGVLASTVKQNGGRVTGVIPRSLIQTEGEFDADEVVRTENLDERKRIMLDRADAIIVLPGGNGTLEEAVEVGTLYQLDEHKKPMVFVNVDGFWDDLKAQYAKMHREGFINARIPFDPIFVDTVEEVLPKLDELLAGPTADIVQLRVAG